MASTYLSKTFSAGNQKTWTWSFWTKIPNYDASNNKAIFSGYNDANNLLKIQFTNTDQFQSYGLSSGSLVCRLVTNQLFRDYNAWYHIVYSLDTTQATSTDRQKLWVNGEEITSFSTRTDPSQNADLQINNTIGHQIGATNNADHYSNCMAHCHFIDGTRYDASYFGQTDATSGIWKPKISPSVTYGTNGFFLKFGNAGSLGTDSSGNGNNFTVNGSGTQTLDTPSNVFATLNPLINFQNSSSYSNGNNTVTGGGTGSGDSPSSTLAVSSGKYYCEVKIISTDAGGEGVGIIDIDKWNPYANADEWFFRYSYGYGYANANGNKFNNNSGSAYGDSYTNGDIVGIALDLDNNYLYFSKNGVWQNSGDPTSGASGTGSAFNIASGNYVFSFYHYYSHVLSTNFGNPPFTISSGNSDGNGFGNFEYAPPTNYFSLCSSNLAEYG